MGDAGITERRGEATKETSEEVDIIKPPQKLLDHCPGLGHLVLLLLQISVIIQSSRGQLVKISLMFVKLGPGPRPRYASGQGKED